MSSRTFPFLSRSSFAYSHLPHFSIAVKGAASRLYEKWKKLQDDYNATQQGSSATSSSKKPSSSSSSKDKDPVKRKSASSEDGELPRRSFSASEFETDEDRSRNVQLLRRKPRSLRQLLQPRRNHLQHRHLTLQ